MKLMASKIEGKDLLDTLADLNNQGFVVDDFTWQGGTHINTITVKLEQIKFKKDK